MGSVSSLINGSSLNSKHCKASDFRLKKGPTPHRKSGGCSLDGLLKCSFTQCSSTNAHPAKGLSHSRSGRSEDFFYIKVRKLKEVIYMFITLNFQNENMTFLTFPYKVSHKPKSVYASGGSMEDHVGEKRKDRESNGRLQPALLLMSEKITEMVRKNGQNTMTLKRNNSYLM